MSASLDTLPAELLYKIFQVLDRETKLSISLVSYYCRAVIHSLCWQALNTKAKELRFDPVQLRSWGWEEEFHNFLSCNCIDIHLDFKPFRSSEPVTVQEVRAKKDESIHPTCAITPTKIFVGSTSLADPTKNTSIQVFDRINVRAPPVTFQTFEAMTEIHLYCYENTLVLLERRTQENFITSVISVNNFKLSIWNTETLELVQYVDFLDKIQDIPRDNVHTEISDVAIEKDSLAVHVFVTNLDWLLPDEVIQNPQSKNISLFWSLDTVKPTKLNVNFRTLIRKSLVEGNICDTGFIFLNQSYFLRYLSGLFASDNRPKFATKIQVFKAKDLEKVQPWIVDINQSDVLDFGDCNDDSLKLEPGTSSRVAAFNVYNSTFKIIDIVKREPVLLVDLSSHFGLNSMFSVWQMYDANWVGGNFMFVKDVPQLNSNKKMLQVIVVTKNKNKTDHLPQFQNFLTGTSISPVLEFGDVLTPGTRVHVDLAGVAIVNEDFMLNSSFNSSQLYKQAELQLSTV